MEDTNAQVPASDELSDAEIRTVSNVETLKALADPTRLKLLTELMRRDLPVMSVKELAAALDEPQTKLYRHIKLLEEAGLVRAVSSRVVSGIVEQRYQACQRDLMFGQDLTNSERGSTTMESMVEAGFDLYRKEFFAAQRAGLLPEGTAFLSISRVRLPVDVAAAFKERLQAVYQEMEQADGQPDGDEAMSTVNVMMAYFSTTTDDY